jgi:dTDP-glucose 4,6-dehydratase
MPSNRHTPRSVLVTGGAGFIGSNYLLTAVPRHSEVRFVNLDALTYAGQRENLASLEELSNYAFEQGDIADRGRIEQLFDKHEFDTVIHFAAESHVDRSILDPLAFVRTNVLGTATLLEVARQRWGNRKDVRFHHVSTDEVFGALGPEGFFTEDTPYAPRSPYSASKAGADHLVRAYHETYGLPTVISNASNNYGPLQYPEKLIPLVIQNAVNRDPVPVYGKGENVRDWLHVLDHCDAIDRILRTAENGTTYLVGGDEERSNLDIVHLLLDLVDEALGREAGTSRELIRFVTDRPGHDFRYALDSSRLAGELDWRPSRSLEQGLRETVAWYLANPEWLEHTRSRSYDEYYTTQYRNRIDTGNPTQAT